MKAISLSIISLVLFTQCKKGESYCEEPHELKALFVEYQNFQDDSILVSMDYAITFEEAQNKTLFSFSTPNAIFNPKGDRPTDVVKDPFYYYKLKDTSAVPDSVYIEAYAFNDCGKSEVKGAWIHFQP